MTRPLIRLLLAVGQLIVAVFVLRTAAIIFLNELRQIFFGADSGFYQPGTMTLALLVAIAGGAWASKTAKGLYDFTKQLRAA